MRSAGAAVETLPAGPSGTGWLSLRMVAMGPPKGAAATLQHSRSTSGLACRLSQRPAARTLRWSAALHATWQSPRAAVFRMAGNRVACGSACLPPLLLHLRHNDVPHYWVHTPDHLRCCRCTPLQSMVYSSCRE